MNQKRRVSDNIIGDSIAEKLRSQRLRMCLVPTIINYIQIKARLPVDCH
jgi:hypothetical protein